jgi:hypothetical protein
MPRRLEQVDDDQLLDQPGVVGRQPLPASRELNRPADQHPGVGEGTVQRQHEIGHPAHLDIPAPAKR